MNKRLVVEALYEEANRIADDWACPTPEIKLSARFGGATAAQIACAVGTGGVKYTVKVNSRYIEAFGIERGIKSLRHEMAHLIQHELSGIFSHDREFLEICDMLGGSISPNVVQPGFEHLVSTEFLPKRYEYYCGGCGRRIATRDRKISDPSKYQCRHCKTGLDNAEIKVNY